jgi:hypothetical protein
LPEIFAPNYFSEALYAKNVVKIKRAEENLLLFRILL